MSKSVRHLSPQQPFPVHALPPTLRDAVLAVHRHVQSPISMAATLAISVASEAIQGLVDVQIPHGPRCTSGNWVLILAKTGDGKSPSLKLLRHLIVEFEAEQKLKFDARMEKYRSDHEAWELILAELKASLRKEVRAGEYLDAAKEALAKHMRDEPIRPRQVRLTYDDVTPPKFLCSLYDYWSVACLVTDEGGQIIWGPMAQHFPMINQRWEIYPLIMDRQSLKERVYVPEPRVTMNWSIQPEEFDRYMARHGDRMRALGTASRFLVCRPDSLQGSRDTSPQSLDNSLMVPFYDQIRAFLSASIGDDGQPMTGKQTVTFSPEAEQMFHNVRADIERAMGPGGSLSGVADFGAKASRHLAKLAATFELYQSGCYVISLDSMQRAYEVLTWFINEYIRLFAPVQEVPQAVQDVNELYQTLHQLAAVNQNRYVRKSDARKCLTGGLRNHLRLEQALQSLMWNYQIGRYCNGSKEVIDVWPGLPFHQQAFDLATVGRRY